MAAQPMVAWSTKSWKPNCLYALVKLRIIRMWLCRVISSMGRTALTSASGLSAGGAALIRSSNFSRSVSVLLISLPVTIPLRPPLSEVHKVSLIYRPVVLGNPLIDVREQVGFRRE